MADISIANAAKLLRTRGKKIDREVEDAVDGPKEDDTEGEMSQADFTSGLKKGLVDAASEDDGYRKGPTKYIRSKVRKSKD